MVNADLAPNPNDPIWVVGDHRQMQDAAAGFFRSWRPGTVLVDGRNPTPSTPTACRSATKCCTPGGAAHRRHGQRRSTPWRSRGFRCAVPASTGVAFVVTGHIPHPVGATLVMARCAP